jgi:NRPS condensation-like uncharacterized protein
LPAYPSMAVRMRKGLFWNYFDNNDNEPRVSEENDFPCSRIDPASNNGYLFRVVYFNKRISVECFHSLTDGRGAIEFLKSLLFEYFKLSGYEVASDGLIKEKDDLPRKFETEDSFLKYYDPKITEKKKESSASKIEGHYFNKGMNIVHGVMSARELNASAKIYDCTITEFLVSLYIFSIYSENMRYGLVKDKVKISVPIDLRKIFPSITLRNFSSYVNIGVSVKEDLTMTDIAASVKDQLRDGVKKENIYPKINSNVKAEKNILLRICPLVIKNLILKQVFKMQGDRLMTTNFSNMGRIELPGSMIRYVDRFYTLIHSSKPIAMNSTACTFDDKLVITFSRAIFDPNIIRCFFCFLSDRLAGGVKIYSNGWEGKYENL